MEIISIVTYYLELIFHSMQEQFEYSNDFFYNIYSLFIIWIKLDLRNIEKAIPNVYPLLFLFHILICATLLQTLDLQIENTICCHNQNALAYILNTKSDSVARIVFKL